MKLFGRENHFYHGSVRRYVALFGSLFSDVYIKRTSDTKEEFIKVPIRYGNGNMYLKVAQDKTRDNQQLTRILPAMAFELDSFYKDVNRKTNPMNRIKAPTFKQITDTLGNIEQSTSYQFNRVPYNFIFKLMIRTKNSDDMMQIVEQIVPAFDGNLVVTIEDTTGVKVEQDISIGLQEIEMTDNYDDEMQSRLIEWSITFELKGYLYKRTLSAFTVNEIDLMGGTTWDNQEVIEAVTTQGDIQDEQIILSNFTGVMEKIPPL